MNTIMVVEDVAIFREPLAASLQQAGYRAICAGDGLAALKLLKLEHPDLVLLDISLPTMDGLTFLKYFRSISEYVNTPVIVLSGASGNQQVMQAAALGVRDYMLKSRLKLSDLLARVEAKLKDVVGVVPQVSEAAPAVASVAPVAAVAAPAVVTPAPAVAAPTVATEEGIPQLMTREQCI